MTEMIKRAETDRMLLARHLDIHEVHITPSALDGGTLLLVEHNDGSSEIWRAGTRVLPGAVQVDGRWLARI